MKQTAFQVVAKEEEEINEAASALPTKNQFIWKDYCICFLVSLLIPTWIWLHSALSSKNICSANEVQVVTTRQTSIGKIEEAVSILADKSSKQRSEFETILSDLQEIRFPAAENLSTLTPTGKNSPSSAPSKLTIRYRFDRPLTDNSIPPIILLPTVPRSSSGQLRIDINAITGAKQYTVFQTASEPHFDVFNWRSNKHILEDSPPYFVKCHDTFISILDQKKLNSAEIGLILKSHRHPISNWDSWRRWMFEVMGKTKCSGCDFKSFGPLWYEHHKFWQKYSEENGIPIIDYSFEEFIADRPKVLSEIFSNQVLRNYYGSLSEFKISSMLDPKPMTSKVLSGAFIRKSAADFQGIEGKYGDMIYSNELKASNLDGSDDIEDFLTHYKDLLDFYGYSIAPGKFF